MKKEYLDVLYKQRSWILNRAEKLKERDTFDGSEGSCDEPIWRMQVVELDERLKDLDKIISEYLLIHGA